MNHVYHLNNVQISAKELGVAKLTLQMLSNPYDTLLFRISSEPTGQTIAQYQFTEKSIDTVLYIHYLPYATNSFGYSIFALSLIDSSSGYVRVTSDTYNFNRSDTISVSKKFNSAYDIPLKLY